MGLEVLMGLIVIFLHRRFLERPVHAFHLPIRLGMVDFGHSLVNALLTTETSKDMVDRL